MRGIAVSGSPSLVDGPCRIRRIPHCRRPRIVLVRLALGTQDARTQFLGFDTGESGRFLDPEPTFLHQGEGVGNTRWIDPPMHMVDRSHELLRLGPWKGVDLVGES